MKTIAEGDMVSREPFETYVINLDRSQERLEMITDCLNRLEIGFTRVSAVDAHSISETELVKVRQEICMRTMGRRMSIGEVACFISHRLALQEFVKSGAAFALILEDDAVLSQNAKKEISAICRFLEANPQLACRLVNLGREANHQTRAIEIENCPTLIQAFYAPMGAFALLWRRKAAEEFFKMTVEINAPYDNSLQNWLCLRGGGYALKNPIANVVNVPSDIDGTPAGHPLRRSEKSSCIWHRTAKRRRMIKNRLLAAVNMLVHFTFANRR